MTRRRRAFTLVEILLVVAIIVLLATITVTVGSSAKANARLKRARQELTTLNGLLRDYEQRHPPLTAASAPDPLHDWLRLLSIDPDIRRQLASFTLVTLPPGIDEVKDPYGGSYRFAFPTLNAANTEVIRPGYLFCAGPDQTPGTADDVRVDYP